MGFRRETGQLAQRDQGGLSQRQASVDKKDSLIHHISSGVVKSTTVCVCGRLRTYEKACVCVNRVSFDG